MPDLRADETAALAAIADIRDPARLRALVRNARSKGSVAVERAAFDRLCDVQPSSRKGSVEHDVWRSVHALEEMLTSERNRTTRLSRTRQKIARVGEIATAADLTMASKPSDGFNKLVERGCPHLLFEAVVLRHAGEFEEPVVAAARARLSENRIELDQVLQDTE